MDGRIEAGYVDGMRRLPMFWQIFLGYGLFMMPLLGLLGSTVVAWITEQMLQQVERQLETETVLVHEMVRGRPLADVQTRLAALREQRELRDLRVTLVAGDGTVVADTDVDDANAPENLAGQPEIEAARLTGQGRAIRENSGSAKTMMYVARCVDDPEVCFVRVSRPVSEIRSQMVQLYPLLWGALFLSLGVALPVAYVLASRINQPVREVADAAQRIAQGDYGHKVYLDRGAEVGTLARAFNHMSDQLLQQFDQLDEDRQQLRAVLSSMVEGVIAIDAEQRILFANDRAGQLLEFAARQASGRKLWEVVRQRPLQDVVRRILTETRGQSEALECGGPSNRTFAVHVTQLPGEPVRGAVLVFSDTTELRRLERLRQDFVANVSHELKTPLSVIAACVETLIDGAAEDSAHRGRFLERVAEQAGRLHTLILDLLSLARIESGAEHLVLEDLPLDAAVRECLERHEERARSKEQCLEAVAPDGEGVIARADQEAVREILDNLVDNAVKYTPAGGTIRLRWWQEGEACLLEVSDTGIGIPEIELPRVFERFYRVDKARSRELGGTGLGLSIVKHLAQAMQGNVRATSEVGKGTTFTVTLPCPPVVLVGERKRKSGWMN
jgi:two-component system, OmpR family, phosphate regulon sensor histidine kinase PhoR